ncbi:MAG: hypothetical protein AABY22_26450, partial [Nanoarchaeota archaeon]
MNEEYNKYITEEIKKKVLDRWNNKELSPPSLLELCELCFGSGVDGRDKRAKYLKILLSELKIKAPSTSHYVKRSALIVLTEEQKLFCRNYPSMSSLEQAREIFNKPNLTGLDIETRAVQTFRKTIPEFKNEAKEALELWKAPRNSAECLARINKHIVKKLDANKLTPQQRKDVENAITMLQDVRFNQIINTFQKEPERELFERTFLKHIYDKSDISSEEVDLYMNLALNIVNQAQAMERKNCLSELFLTAAVGSDGTRASQSIGDQIDSITKEINDNEQRQQKLINKINNRCIFHF